ncbi:hypothetical protein AAFF_G00095670 [Aldrovandia affinis]|uniref:Uncharacterized protein n=1 Tax=Aldrovandia affinis TaxID=143900 RepID=A0AAD7WC11_9TELE|nr:hypothetical protein AAFF_G00095670 [Aldrovandia affinis]
MFALPLSPVPRATVAKPQSRKGELRSHSAGQLFWEDFIPLVGCITGIVFSCQTARSTQARGSRPEDRRDDARCRLLSGERSAQIRARSKREENQALANPLRGSNPPLNQIDLKMLLPQPEKLKAPDEIKVYKGALATLNLPNTKYCPGESLTLEKLQVTGCSLRTVDSVSSSFGGAGKVVEETFVSKLPQLPPLRREPPRAFLQAGT